MSIIYPPGLGPGQIIGLNSAFAQQAFLHLPYVTEGVLTGLTAGAGSYTRPYSVWGRNVIRLQVDGNVTGLSLTAYASLGLLESDQYFALTPQGAGGAAITTAGIVVLDGYYSLLKLLLTSVTGANPNVTLLTAAAS